MHDAGTADVDLAAEVDGAWAEVRAAAARGDRSARLVLRVLDDLDVLVDTSVRRICDALPSYRDGEITPREDLWWSLYRNDQALLLLLAEGRALRADELAVRAHLGTRRAEQGMPVTDLLRAYRIGYSTVWQALVDAARAAGIETERELMARAILLWGALDEISSAVADAHRAVAEARDLDARLRGVRFVDGLRNLPAGRGATENLARRLGFDPGGRFVCAVFPGLRLREGPPGRGVVLEQPDVAVAIVQPRSAAARSEQELAAWLRAQGVQHGGVGLARSGLDGAAASLADAERAQRAAHALDADVLAFRSVWFEALVLDAAPRIAPLVDGTAQVLRVEGDLRETVERYLEAGGNLTVSGRALHVHPNSIAYRLRRLLELTGVDARTPDGALLVRAALIVARADGGRANLQIPEPDPTTNEEHAWTST